MRAPSPSGRRRRARTMGSKGNTSSRAASRRSIPCPVSAEMATAGDSAAAPEPPSRRRRYASTSVSASGSRSTLFNTSSCGMAAASISARTLSTCPVCAVACGAETSTTCRIRVASVTSSRVARKAFTSVAGRFPMKPTVSLTSTRRREGSVTGRTVGSSVANMRASASTAGGQRHRTDRRIERGEHARIGQHGGLCEAVEERRFSGVGVAHQRNRRQGGGVPLAAVQRASGAHAIQILLDFLDAAVDAAAIGFQLRLTGAARADAAARPGHLDAPAGQARQQIIQLREFHLQAALTRARAMGEDIQDELRAIDDAARKLLLQVALLSGRQVVVEDDQAGIRGLAQLRQLLHFALADEGGGFG